MTEQIIVRQNHQFETEISPLDHRQPASDEFQLKGFEQPVTPGGLLLASLGACTAVVLHRYAQNHNLELDAVEIRLRFERISPGNDKDSKPDDRPPNRIQQEIKLIGRLDPETERKVYLICRQCSISSMLAQGIEIESHLLNSDI